MRPPPSATVGVLGCSNTQDAVSGYHRATTSAKLWSDRDLQGYGGKCVVDWANPDSPTWRNFSQNLTRYKLTDRVWWQLCTHSYDSPTQAHAEASLAILRQKTELPLLVSPMDLTPSCQRSEKVVSQQMVEALIAGGHAGVGPILSPLELWQTVDNCHATPEGALIWGQQLADFFG